MGQIKFLIYASNKFLQFLSFISIGLNALLIYWTINIMWFCHLIFEIIQWELFVILDLCQELDNWPLNIFIIFFSLPWIGICSCCFVQEVYATIIFNSYLGFYLNSLKRNYKHGFKLYVYNLPVYALWYTSSVMKWTKLSTWVGSLWNPHIWTSWIKLTSNVVYRQLNQPVHHWKPTANDSFFIHWRT